MRLSLSSGLLLVVLVVCSLAVVRAAHVDDETYFEAATNKLASLWPFGTHNSKLGHDWSDTQNKVEDIYRRTHDDAKTRVDELREETIRESDIQKKIADIYQEEALKAEREIEALKHPMMEKLTSWMYTHGREPSSEEKRSIFEKLGFSSSSPSSSSSSSSSSGSKGLSKFEDILPHHIFDDTSRKISDTYRSALDQAKSKLGDVSGKLGEAGSAASNVAGQGWQSTKSKAAQAYSEAFHKGHGEARTKFGQLRDLMSRGVRGVGSTVKSAAMKTIELIFSVLMSAVWMMLGAVAAVYALRLWNRRKFHQQLNASVAGPVMAVGEYCVVGGEAEQRKFYEFWSGTAYKYFSAQPGLRKYWMHRGVPGAENMWLCYSEWATIEDLRRASNSSEFCEIKKRSPVNTLNQMYVYQLASTGGIGSNLNRPDGELTGKDNTGGGVRQRTTTTTSVAT